MKDLADVKIAPIQKTVTVPLPPDRAFALFTTGIGQWWPGATHSLSARDGKSQQKIEVEPKKGGRSWETTHDGRRLPWARITEWEPGRRFVFNWHVGTNEEEATEVVVAFSQAGTGTRVDLTHGGFEQVTGGSEMVNSYQTGWDKVLKTCFGQACQSLITA